MLNRSLLLFFKIKFRALNYTYSSQLTPLTIQVTPKEPTIIQSETPKQVPQSNPKIIQIYNQLLQLLSNKCISERTFAKQTQILAQLTNTKAPTKVYKDSMYA